MDKQPPGLALDRLTVTVPAPTDGAHRTNTFRYLLDHVVRPRKNTLVDLGAGPCIFAKIARDRGYQVDAVDGRTVRLPPPEELGSINFIQSDVRHFDPSGYGIVVCFGLLYHLTIGDQVDLLRRCADGATVILETELHDPTMVTAKEPDPWQTTIVRRDRYEGVIFTENDNPMASIDNPQSFWHTERSILRLFADTGYSSVTMIEPRFQSKYGARQFFVLSI